MFRWVAGMIVLCGCASGAPALAQSDLGRCSATGPLARMPELPEASGVAVSRRTPGRLYAHNDSGSPTLFTLDARGQVVGKLHLESAEVDDWEGIDVGPCPSGSCIYVGDIGDNDGNRRSITIYRVAEPADASGSLTDVDALHARYPDGPHDAETIMVAPAGDVLIATKGETGPLALYRLPRDAKPGTTVTLELVARASTRGRLSPDERITDGAISPDGATIALRTTRSIAFFGAADLLAGRWHARERIPLDPLREPQGEGMAFADAATLFVVGEGGGKGQAGTFAQLTCAR